MNRAECVVCLTNKRELAILPCRHMCVCRACAAECIQSQDSRCPICRNREFQREGGREGGREGMWEGGGLCGLVPAM
jgi:hypothetical protein